MDPRAEVRQLEEERRALEASAALLVEKLRENGGPGPDGPLVDREGFPLPDVDLYQVRVDRRKLNELRADLAALMGRLHEVLARLHESARAGPSSGGGSGAGGGPRAMETDAAFLRPFALVVGAAPGSPGEAAGLRAGDQVLDVAGITAATYRGDPGQIAEGLRAHEGRAVAVAVLRAGMPTEVTLTPRTWAGPGLLGCQLRSLT